MTSREKFEAWYLENWGHTEDDHETLFERCPDGDEYYRLGVRMAHEAWKAAELSSQQKLTDMAVQLANAESKCRDLAAENGEAKKIISECREYFIAGVMNRIRPTNEGYLHNICDTFADETPATDAFLAEVRASELDSLAGVAETMLVKFSNQRCSQDMHEVVGWKMVLQQASNRAAQLRKGAAL
ncbi:hypothetical protein FDX19_21000 [Citrobacter sp. wls619]|uniref:hypothetical protein n=1 Tax=Citrobacter sp. wls619 TaxID=2576432 RepID=UPI0010C94D61|nr:hypothetical protein [Citrobacter sp. wls619]TKV06450.1 hypothetical protein FDX19_21000 [Citrobacter sp. wls619]